MSRTVFLAYASEDRPIAQRLKSALDALGAVTLDPIDSITPGDAWSDMVMSDIAASDALLFVVPRHEGAGKNALVEAGAARALGKPIVGIMPEARRYANAQVAYALSDHRMIDTSDLSDDKLAQSLASLLN